MTRRVTCLSAQEHMSAMLAGAATGHERLEAEAHAARCARCGAALRDFVAASVALDRAYAPLRSRSAGLSPARVHFAMRIPETVPAASRFSRITARTNELGLAAAVTAFAFVGSASVPPQHTIIDDAVLSGAVTLTRITAGPDDQYFLRWSRLGRYAPQTDILDPAVSPNAYADDVVPPAKPDRAGLVR